MADGNPRCIDVVKSFKMEKALEALPFVKTETDLAIRPEGTGSGRSTQLGEKDGWNFDVSDEYFMNKVWPALASLIPPMEELKRTTWRGHYARSQFDLSPFQRRLDRSGEFSTGYGFQPRHHARRQLVALWLN